MPMTSEQENRCHAIIHLSATAAATIGGGLAQIPGSDSVPITGIQAAMIIGLGEVFGKKLTKSGATTVLAGAITTPIGRGISQVLVGWIPGWGNFLNASTAFGITETLGWSIANMFCDEYEKEQKEKENKKE